MKKLIVVMLVALMAVPMVFAAESNLAVSDLEVKGKIEGENIVFDLTFEADAKSRHTYVPLVSGDVAHLGSELPRGSSLSRSGNTFAVELPSKGKSDIKFQFASRAVKDGLWRQTKFVIPAASVRKLSVVCDRDDLEIVFPGALSVVKSKTKEGLTEVTAFLGIASEFAVRWKPTVKKLSGDLVVACDANTIASASVGALKLDNVYTYRVVQGALKAVSFDLPENLNITQVKGLDIQDWSIEKGKDKTRTLQVTLSRHKEDTYKLQVECEVVLSKFPCSMDLPVMVPRDVIRSSGFVMVGTDSAIKLLVSKALGLTQVDQVAFPAVAIEQTQKDAKGHIKKIAISRPLPSRSKFAYQYANTPYTLKLSADDIVPEYSGDEQHVLYVKDSDLILNTSLELDVRDAPAREIVIETDPKWIVANVEGASLSDYDVRDENGKRNIYVYFRDAVIGRTLINVRMEQTLKDEDTEFAMPSFVVDGAKSERGYIVLAAEQGMRLKQNKMSGMREVHTGSVDARVAGAQLAYRFKEAGWELSLNLERTKPTIHSEIFHLVSIGEGVLYCSSVITYHIDGAPVRSFKMLIPSEYKNVEFTGRDVRGWEHDGENWIVSLQEKVIGDYTLGVTYDTQFAYQGDDITVGSVKTEGTTSESGYIVMASSASLNLTAKKKDASIIPIDRNEVPEAYALLVNDPILSAYKYVKTPHVAEITVKRYDTEQLLNQVADHNTLSTVISRDGEAVTTVVFSIKNLSKQHLKIALPEGAKLWSTMSVDEHGNKADVSSMKEGGFTYIPINRLKNPNLPVRLEVVYAQSLKKLGVMGRKLKMQAPVTPETHSTFTKWDFRVPEKYAIAGVSGNMTITRGALGHGIAGLIAGLFMIGGLAVSKLLGFTIIAGYLLIGISCIAHACGSKKPLWWRVLLFVGFGIPALVIAGGIQMAIGDAGIYELTDIMFQAGSGSNVMSVTRTINLASAQAMMIKIGIIPSWVGAHGSLLWAIVAIVIGLFITVKSIPGFKEKPMHSAFGLTVLMFGLAEMAVGRTIILTGVVFALPVILVIMVIKFSYRHGVKNPATAPEKSVIETELPPPFEEVDEIDDEGSSEKDSGNMKIWLMIVMAGLCMASAAVAKKVAVPVKPELEAMKVVNMTVQTPEMKDDSERSGTVKAEIEFETEMEGKYLFLKPPAVLREFKLNSRHLDIQVSRSGYMLIVKKAGSYKILLDYSVPVVEKDGDWSMGLQMPRNLQNKVTLNIPAVELDIESSNAVLFKTVEKDGKSIATLVYGSTTEPSIEWRARARKTKLEKVVFFCELNSVAVFKPGVVDVTSLVHYQVAQGELKSMTCVVPVGMSVTAVQAKGLSTWRFDPATRLLEAILEKPVSGEFDMIVSSQVSCEGLPYTVDIGTLQVKDASRQRGALALAVPNTVQVRVKEDEGLNPMNIEDVPGNVYSLATKGMRGGLKADIKRAFRYHSLPASTTIDAERVLPEIRISERSSVSVSDERIVLSSKLDVNVSKAGIFSLKMSIPEGYDVENLTGSNISHWDEIEDGNHGVIVHFLKQAIGKSTINLVVTKTEKGIAKTISVPRVAVADALKHTGSIVVSGERGVRMTTVDREGVSEVNPRELGIRQLGVLAFKLLRPEWQVNLKAEVVAPTIRAEVLQRVDLSEGMLQCSAYVRYKIDHAGCKTFRVKSPVPGVPLAVTGSDISKVSEVDATNGIWEVELHNKAENKYAMDVRYQIPFDVAAKIVEIKSVKTIDVESQKGYLVVMCGGRLQVRPVGNYAGLKLDDSRSVPAHFGVGDLSNAIYCYRTVSGDYKINMSVIRHDSAEVLAANVDNVNMTSVVSDGGQVITRVAMNMRVGDLSFMEMQIPGDDSALWSAFVNGKAAIVSKKENLYRIPLEDSVPGESTAVEFIYANSIDENMFSGKQKFIGPKFGLPLNKINWKFYVVPGQRYHAFGGTMEYQKEDLFERTFSDEYYLDSNKQLIMENRKKAKSVMAQSTQWAKAGNQKRARRALRSAVNYSQNDAAFNEDARIQYKNLAEQQAVVGLVQRRDEMRFERNIQDAGQIQRMEEFNSGDFTADYASKVQHELSDDDNSSLMKLSGKILDQQVAAERVTQAITITMPEHGRELEFYRRLQINPEADMIVTFKTSNKWLPGMLNKLWPVIALFAGFWAVIAHKRRRA